jgi:hypothetical protein
LVIWEDGRKLISDKTYDAWQFIMWW